MRSNRVASSSHRGVAASEWTGGAVGPAGRFGDRLDRRACWCGKSRTRADRPTAESYRRLSVIRHEMVTVAPSDWLARQERADRFGFAGQSSGVADCELDVERSAEDFVAAPGH
jgi:hypothetical protein